MTAKTARTAKIASPTAEATARAASARVVLDEVAQVPVVRADRAPDVRARGEGRAARGERPVAPTSTVHRNAMLATLRPEQIPVAEQLLRGGIPAVRQAIDAQNSGAKTSGKPPASSDALMAMAEKLLPVVKLAEWKDRASVAQTAGKEYRLRELRAVVAASRTVILDDEGRALAKSLQESLDTRVTALRDEWLARIQNGIKEGRVQQALEASIRPPEPGTRCPADLAVQLAQAASEAMTAIGTRRVDAPPRHRGLVPGAPHRQAGGHSRRRGGQAGGSPRGWDGSRPGQAVGIADPTPTTPAGGHRASTQSSRRLSVSSRAVKPAASRRCFDERSPGRASASISPQPRSRHQRTMASISADPTPTPRAAPST